MSKTVFGIAALVAALWFIGVFNAEMVSALDAMDKADIGEYAESECSDFGVLYCSEELLRILRSQQ